jgi:hypothetical protein
MARSIDMKALALRGAAVRLSELRTEVASLLAAFPSLRGGEASAERSDGEAPIRRRRRRSRMSAGQRKAVSIRMKAYWAKRRKQKTSNA